jgi:hypothetical protein
MSWRLLNPSGECDLVPSQTVEFCGHDSGDHGYRNNRDHDITRRENEGKKEEEKKKLKKKEIGGLNNNHPWNILSPHRRRKYGVVSHRPGYNAGEDMENIPSFPISDRLTGQFAIAWFEPTKLPASTERIHDRGSPGVSCFK